MSNHAHQERHTTLDKIEGGVNEKELLIWLSDFRAFLDSPDYGWKNDQVYRKLENFRFRMDQYYAEVRV